MHPNIFRMNVIIIIMYVVIIIIIRQIQHLKVKKVLLTERKGEKSNCAKKEIYILRGCIEE